MKKKTIILLILFAFFLGSLVYLNNHHDIQLWNYNTLKVTVDKPLKSEKIKIEYGVSANYYNRFVMGSIPHRDKYYLLLFDGEVKNEVPYEYGENDFLITYDNKYYLTFRQFKTNWKHHHAYNFHFYWKKNKLYIHADIEGLYNESFNKQMLELNSTN